VIKDEIAMKDKIRLEDVDVSKLCIEIKKHASEARNEEELKIRVESTLRPVLEKWKIQWASYEHSHKISGIRKDALYGTVIIEYKAPLKLDSKRDFEKGKEQVKRYISEEAMDPQYFGRYFGILLDGYKIAFIRYRKDEWEEPDVPLEISPRTVLRVLEAIRGLKRKPIDAEELLIDFGPRSELSKKLILKLYNTISKPKSSRSLMLFEDWQRVFSQVCAYSKDKMVGLIDYYGLKGQSDVDVEKLMFSVHTYYTLQMKLLTSEIVTLFADSLLGSYLKRIEEAYYKGSEDMLSELQDLEEGGIFNTVGIKNFLEADYFAWYLDEWDNELASRINEVVKKLLDYEPATVELSPERVRDLFKRLYQNLVPRDIRHKLGEYFTPDWLAELLLDDVGYYGDPDKSLLDPACGSGTFLVLAINRIKDFAEERFVDKRTLLKRIVENVKGIDLNPLAVQASKANYLIALSDLLRYRPREGIEIPVYLADSILVSRKKTYENRWEVYLKTTEGEFWLPHEVIDKNLLSYVLSLIESCAKNRYAKAEFEKLLVQKIKGLQQESIDSIVRLYWKILSLEKKGKNKIWTRLLKNSFAPLLMGKFDFVVGNPPWINWENLPQYYREETKGLWKYYGLLERTKGMGLGKVKRDMAMMFTARCLDRYVKNDGRYAFLVPFTAFKTQAGAGFRRFLAEGKVIAGRELPCKVVKVHDLVELYPFEGAVNRTAMFVIEKSWKTKFPIPCTMWHNPSSKGMPMDASLGEVEKMTKQFEMVMAPIKDKKPETPWMTGTEGSFSAISKVIRESSWYRAYEGVNTALNGVYWIEIISEQPNSPLIRNPQLSGQKKKVKEVKQVVEKDLVYPLIRGRDVKRWYPSKELGYAILPTNGKGETLSHTKLKVEYPNSYGYFSNFFNGLINRGGEPYKSKLKPYREKSFESAERKSPPFYWLFNASPSMAPYKVVWKYIAGKISGKAEFSTVVLEPIDNEYLGLKTPIPNEKLMLVPFQNRDEAHYVSAILNSSISQLIVASYVIETAISTHILDKIYLPKYSSQDLLHQKLSNLSKKAHELAKKIHEENRADLEMDLERIEEEIDETAAELYGITDKELKEIKNTLMILKEGEAPEEEEEIEKITPISLKPVEIKVEPLLIKEKKLAEMRVTIMNNTNETTRNVKLVVYLRGDKIFECDAKKVGSNTSEIASFNLPELTGGQYEMSFSMEFNIGKERKTLSEKRTLYVKKGKEEKKEKAEFDKELEDLLE